MLGRIVNNVRRKLSNPLKAEARKNSWHNLIRIHNERSLSQISDFEKINYKEVTDVQELNQCVLRVNHIHQSASIEDIATIFPNAIMIIVEKFRSNKFKTAFIGYESESECTKAFIYANQLEIKGFKVIVTFADISFEKKNIEKKVCEERVVFKSNSMN